MKTSDVVCVDSEDMYREIQLKFLSGDTEEVTREVHTIGYVCHFVDTYRKYIETLCSTKIYFLEGHLGAVGAPTIHKPYIVLHTTSTLRARAIVHSIKKLGDVYYDSISNSSQIVNLCNDIVSSTNSGLRWDVLKSGDIVLTLNTRVLLSEALKDVPQCLLANSSTFVIYPMVGFDTSFVVRLVNEYLDYITTF